MKDKRCVATPGPRFEMTVSHIDFPDVFEPGSLKGPGGGGLLMALTPEKYGVSFDRRELPVKLANDYPELLVKEPKPGRPDVLRASSYGAPSIFYLEEGPKTTARLSDLFSMADHRRCPPDLLIRGTPATLVVRPVRYSCHCGGQHRKGVTLELLAIKLAPHAMGLPTYQDFLAEEDKDHEERALEGGHDY